jgi:hypothetical protein
MAPLNLAKSTANYTVAEEDKYVVLIFDATTPDGPSYIEIVLVDWVDYPYDDIKLFLRSG